MSIPNTAEPAAFSVQEEALDALYVPASAIGAKVNATLSSPIALVPMVGPDGQPGMPAHMGCGFTGILREVTATTVVISTSDASILGPPGKYSIAKKCLLACGEIGPQLAVADQMTRDRLRNMPRS